MLDANVAFLDHSTACGLPGTIVGQRLPDRFPNSPLYIDNGKFLECTKRRNHDRHFISSGGFVADHGAHI
jgi:hypothetical protein